MRSITWIAASWIAAGALAAALSGCNAARAPQVAPQPQAARPADPPPPEGSGCAAAAARYRGIVDHDLSMGHVNTSVHAQISNEIAEASSACSNGQEARALSLLRASKSRHGYPG